MPTSTPTAPGLRTIDLFFDEIDKDRMRWPQADMQKRLFARLIGDLLADHAHAAAMVLPGRKRTLLILTGDAHGDWQPVRFDGLRNRPINARTSICLNRISGNPSVSTLKTWRAAGFEFGMHPYGKQARHSKLNVQFVQAYNHVVSRGYGTPSRTDRNHQIAWQGWVDAAKVPGATIWRWTPTSTPGGRR